MINIRYMHNIQQSLYRIQAIDSKGHLSFKYAMALLELRNQGSIILVYKNFNSKPQVLYDLSYLHLVKILSDKPTGKPYESKIKCILTKLGHEYVNYAFQDYPTYYLYPTYQLHDHKLTQQEKRDKRKATCKEILEIGSIVVMDFLFILAVALLHMSIIIMILMLPIPDMSLWFYYQSQNNTIFGATEVPNPRKPHNFGYAFPVSPKLVPKSFPEQGMVLFCISNQLHMLTGPEVNIKDVEHLLDMRMNTGASRLDDLWHLVKQQQGHITELDLLNFLEQHHIRLLNNLRNVIIYDKMFDTAKND